MAIRTECPFYDVCGFVNWRRQRPDSSMVPLPADGDCGKDVSLCGRASNIVPIDVSLYGPQTREELEITFPELPNNNNRPKRRLVGGGFG
jgi:hypothetical protein